MRKPRSERVRAGGQGLFVRMHLNRGLNRGRNAVEGWIGMEAAAPAAPPAHICGANPMQTFFQEDFDNAEE
jgi:hypothetical protein